MNKFLIAWLLPAFVFPVMGAEIPHARLTKPAVAARQVVQGRSSMQQERFAAWSAVKDARPSWPEAVPMPVWNDPVIVPLTRLDDVEWCIRQIAAARAKGRTVLSAWSPAPNTQSPSPAELAAALERVSILCHAFVLAYHRSGAHYIVPSEGEMAFYAAAARKGNPNIALIGEAYFGELASGAENRLSIIAPPGVSGILLCNAARPTAVTANLLDEVSGATGLPVVLAVPDTLAEKYKEYQRVLIIKYDPQNN